MWRPRQPVEPRKAIDKTSPEYLFSSGNQKIDFAFKLTWGPGACLCCHALLSGNVPVRTGIAGEAAEKATVHLIISSNCG